MIYTIKHSKGITTICAKNDKVALEKARKEGYHKCKIIFINI